jgi:hypothetical protein
VNVHKIRQQAIAINAKLMNELGKQSTTALFGDECQRSELMNE